MVAQLVTAAVIDNPNWSCCRVLLHWVVGNVMGCSALVELSDKLNEASAQLLLKNFVIRLQHPRRLAKMVRK